ncbi:4-hydroxythreonine-4-phosphate dehydrogenase [Desulfuromusa kysingii]|uniref:4-hydroxythreonine-4-phosphate dehydrogenase n=1 Tax=Desulfuromusa kysingii TaxID=37625 RepID=A0A1H4E889_9BACT|nr:4-hydroxythreonine-4-phosphate dehydrogenase PdxA [Desulfuromusa kysingii]SEA80790.1 4-hydroxythreonine-4-phosphate dehydrogenase [Desulfuromusa kysingii]
MQPLLLTMGDPTGIGPEIIIKALLDQVFTDLSHEVQVVGDVNVLSHAARIFDCTAKTEKLDDRLYALCFGASSLIVHSRSDLDVDSIHYGQPDTSCGKAMADYIEYAIDRCLHASAAGIVTCPINKAAINAAGYHFPGHTELLAERCGVDKVVMMLAGERLKVCLVTTHLAHRDVPSRLSCDEILQTLRITSRAFQQQFGIAKPRLAVLALNPHASEEGLFGDEEELIIAPAIKAAQAEGITADGPHSADTLFHFAVKGAYDAVICMYHDQGLIPLKLLHFDDAVNVTLGLPIIRTSVDHGTAYDLAGTGKANISSLVAALQMAEQMADNRKL